MRIEETFVSRYAKPRQEGESSGSESNTNANDCITIISWSRCWMLRFLWSHNLRLSRQQKSHMIRRIDLWEN